MGEKNMDLAAVILSGGKSSRMGGQDKAMIEIAGMPIVENTIDILESIFDEILIVTNDIRNYEYSGIRVVRDVIKDIGPLGGIYTGLSSVNKEAVFFVACDMPFLRRDVVLNIINAFKNSDCDVLLPRVGDRIEPLCAVYKSFLKGEIHKYICANQDYAIKRFLKDVKAGYLECGNNDFYTHAFKNVNTPEDAREIMLFGENKLNGMSE